MQFIIMEYNEYNIENKKRRKKRLKKLLKRKRRDKRMNYINNLKVVKVMSQIDDKLFMINKNYYKLAYYNFVKQSKAKQSPYCIFN